MAGLAGLVGGILIAIRGRLSGWGRWVPLAFAVVYNVHGFVAGDEISGLSMTLELVQHLLIGLTAVALITMRTGQRTPVPSAA